MVENIASFEKCLAALFDKLEKKSSNLIDHIFVYIDLDRLSKSDLSKLLFGESFSLITNKRKIFQTIFTDDLLAFAFLSKVSFQKLETLCSEINADIFEERAKGHIKNIYNQLLKNNIVDETEPKKFKITKDVDIFECEINISEADFIKSEIEIEIEKFINMKVQIGKTEFWIEYGAIFTKLSPVYRHLLSIPASNSAVERTFSSAKFIFDDLKGSSSVETVESQVFAVVENL